MRVLITGANGQLGYDVNLETIKRGYQPILTDINNLDITDEKKVISFMIENKPDVIIHCAAYTAVDKAEDNPDICNKVNFLGTKYIRDAAKFLDAKLIYISTDYVFDGKKEGLYEVDDKTNPLSVYGKSKLLGEQEASKHYKSFIVRISWVFGFKGNNFIKTMIRLSKEHDQIKVVNDQFGSPTYTKDLAVLLLDLAESEKYGIYHATNEGICSWYQLASQIMKEIDSSTKVIPIISDQYVTKAIRPKNSSLSKKTLDENGFNRLPLWQDALKRYILELEENEVF